VLGILAPSLSLYYFILINDLRNLEKKNPGSGKGFSSGFWDAVKVAINYLAKSGYVIDIKVEIEALSLLTL
jgi:hypothetical protein